MSQRDEFTEKTKKILQERVGGKCSNPECRQPTSGPNQEPMKATRIGVAAHITAAAKGGPRFDPNQSPDERRSIDNAIWLCQNCSKLIDSNDKKYSKEVLYDWKHLSERQAEIDLKGAVDVSDHKKWKCPHCGTYVENGLFVCVGCHAELCYGLTKGERKEYLSMGGFIGLIAGMFTLYGVLYLISLLESFLSFKVLPDDPRGIIADFLLGFIVLCCLLGAGILVKIKESAQIKEPPRFIRKRKYHDV